MPETSGFSLPPEQENNTHRIDKLRSKRIQNNYLYKINCKAIHTFSILIVRLVRACKMKNWWNVIQAQVVTIKSNIVGPLNRNYFKL